MKYLIIPIIILLSFSVAYSAIMCQTCPEGYVPLSQEGGCQKYPFGETPEIIPCPNQSEWLTEMKSLYQNYIDSGIFFVIAIEVFFPIIISGLFGMFLGIKGSVSIFLLGIFLGILTFLSYPVLVKYLAGMI